MADARVMIQQIHESPHPTRHARVARCCGRMRNGPRSRSLRLRVRRGRTFQRWLGRRAQGGRRQQRGRQRRQWRERKSMSGCGQGPKCRHPMTWSRSRVFASYTSAVSIACGAVACGSTSTSSGAPTDGGRGSELGGAGGIAGTSGTGDVPSTGARNGAGGSSAAGGSITTADGSTNRLGLSPQDEACRSGSDVTLCMTCCDNNHPNAYLTQASQTRDCACASPGSCASVCADNYCVSGENNADACYACVFPTLAPGAACYGASLRACGQSSPCIGYVNCRANCVR